MHADGGNFNACTYMYKKIGEKIVFFAARGRHRHGNFPLPPPARVVVAYFHVRRPLAIIYSFYLRLLGAFAGNFDACSV
jgi:hypothetical protein